MNCRTLIVLPVFLAGVISTGCQLTTTPRTIRSLTGTVVYVQAGALNLRTCPATSCEIIAVLERARPVTILSDHGDWLQVKVHDSSRTGWLSARYVGAGLPVVPETKPGRGAGGHALPTEEFAPVGPAVPTINEEYAPVGKPPPAIREEFAE